MADASVIINLNATRCARQILSAFSLPLYVSTNACIELEDGARNGHRDHEMLISLINSGHFSPVSVEGEALPIYEQLVNGSALSTLDDGEAATIAYAYAVNGIAVIDERKARALCVKSFPELKVASTIDLLGHAAVANVLGLDRQAGAIANALTEGRMRVPPEHLDRVVAMIGQERAASCLSLPKSIRQASAQARET